MHIPNIVSACVFTLILHPPYTKAAKVLPRKKNESFSLFSSLMWTPADFLIYYYYQYFAPSIMVLLGFKSMFLPIISNLYYYLFYFRLLQGWNQFQSNFSVRLRIILSRRIASLWRFIYTLGTYLKPNIFRESTISTLEGIYAYNLEYTNI